MEQRSYDYFAFISYSRKDEKWAQWIQRKLETYRFPVTLRKNHQDLPKKIFPVFRDKTDLVSGELWESLKRQMEESEYLIVICSPNSAQAEWVNNEVSYFRSLGRNDKIIPLIVDGDPHAADPARECFCPVLRDSGADELLGVSIRELGRQKALLRVIAGITRLKFDTLYQREKKRKQKKQASAALASVILLLAGVSLLWYLLPHSRYYRAVVYRNELPEGRYELSKSEMKQAYQSYRITTRKNKVVQLDSVNSAGTPIPETLSFSDINYPTVRFTYDEKGALHSAAYYDATGEPQLTKSYNGLNSVDFINPDNKSLPGKSNLFDSQDVLSVIGEIHSSRFEIARELLTFDENGYVVSERYMWDNRNLPTCDRNGAYETRFERDERGFITRKAWYDAEGQPLSIGRASVFCYRYDEAGRLTEESCFGADGQPAKDEELVHRYEFRLDENGRIESQRTFDESDSPCCSSDGVAETRFSYDKNGFGVSVAYYDESGKPAYTKSNGVHAIRYENDENGRQIRESFEDENGAPAYDVNAVSSTCFTYDKAGKVVSIRYLDASGAPTYWCVPSDDDASGNNAAKNARIAGAGDDYGIGFGGNNAGYDVTRPEQNIERISYLNTDGEPAICYNGFAILEIEYNDAKLPVWIRFFNQNSQPVRAARNAAAIELVYNDSSRLKAEKYYDENGKLCRNIFGAAEVRLDYDPSGKPSKRSYYDENGDACYVAGEDDTYYSIVEYGYDSRGNLSSERRYNENHVPVDYNGFEVRKEYDEKGALIAELYYDRLGQLVNRINGFAVREYERDEQGRILTTRYYTKDRTLPESIYYRYEYSYDPRGNMAARKRYYSDEQGQELCAVETYEYDGRDNLIKETNRTIPEQSFGQAWIAQYEYTYDASNRKLSETSRLSSGELYGASYYTYDEFSRVAENKAVAYSDGEPVVQYVERFSYNAYGYQETDISYDADGMPMAVADNVAGLQQKIDVRGNLISFTKTGTDGKPAERNGWARVEYEYDAMGHTVLSSYYDKNLEPIKRATGSPAVIRNVYDEVGQMTERLFYDEAGRLLAGDDGSARQIFVYSLDGARICSEDYDESGALIRSLVYLPVITEVAPGSAAEKAGLQVGDVLVRFGSWDLFADERIDRINYLELSSALDNGFREEKTVVTGKTDAERQTAEILSHTFPAGFTGLKIETAEFDKSFYEVLRAAARTDR